jgi:hypothetical protein
MWSTNLSAPSMPQPLSRSQNALFPTHLEGPLAEDAVVFAVVVHSGLYMRKVFGKP